MKYLCFGHLNVEAWNRLSETEQSTMIDACFSYDDILREQGHFAGGHGLAPPQECITLQYREGKVVTIDGPYTETKEQLGGLLILEARDLNQAIQLISAHPGVRMGTWVIQPTVDLTPMIEASEARRAPANPT